MDETTIKVYARADETGRVEAVLDTAPRGVPADIRGTDVLLREGYGDCYAYPPERGQLYDSQGRHNYKIVDGQITACTEEDKAAEMAAWPAPDPAPEDQLASLRAQVAEQQAVINTLLGVE